MDVDSSAWSSEEPSSEELFSRAVVLLWADPGPPPVLRGRVLNDALHGFSSQLPWAQLSVVLDSFNRGRRAHGLSVEVWVEEPGPEQDNEEQSWLSSWAAGGLFWVEEGPSSGEGALERRLTAAGAEAALEKASELAGRMRSPVETAKPHHVLAHRTVLHLKDLNRGARVGRVSVGAGRDGSSPKRSSISSLAKLESSACGIGGKTGLEGGGLDRIKGVVRCTGGDEPMSAKVPSE
ncbi:hypothetical protein TOPH_01611 [Tolypocladium ophioglossoides CBS 100239]|uniref:Uncharacterized protein n=1 Tax=Tolypocladium ophioglossoides (strain CBS 100239) TaxID=1163406 RepID=A0A0L0NIR0_TOLOC|nr:hypothetical protein TOPH_01611 [Tolypocladium ophioglossoides CBS 100239]